MSKGNIIVVSLFIMAIMVGIYIVYTVFSPMYSFINPEIESRVNETNSSMIGEAITTIRLSEVVWQYWPLVLLFLLFFFWLAATQKREPVHGYSGGY